MLHSLVNDIFPLQRPALQTHTRDIRRRLPPFRSGFRSGRDVVITSGVWFALAVLELGIQRDTLAVHSAHSSSNPNNSQAHMVIFLQALSIGRLGGRVQEAISRMNTNVTANPGPSHDMRRSPTGGGGVHNLPNDLNRVELCRFVDAVAGASGRRRETLDRASRTVTRLPVAMARPA